MPTFTISAEAMGKILEKLTRLGSSFLIFGGAIILISIYVNHVNGLKLGVLTLFFGGIFRLYNGFTKTFMMQVKDKEVSWSYFTFITTIRFIVWFSLIILYLYFANLIII